MAQVRKLNRILTIEECRIDDFLEMGYDLIDETGKAIKYGKSLNIKDLVAENNILRNKVESLEEENKKLNEKVKVLEEENSQSTEKAELTEKSKTKK
ncbi:putative phage domain protein [Clostridioides difficile CD160]|nr:putative phage domain protein [Clostridioides difficile CD160]